MLSNKDLNSIIKKHNNKNCIKGHSKLDIKQKNKLVNKKAPELYKKAIRKNPAKTIEGEIINLDLADDRVSKKKKKQYKKK
tara:strand:+ start:539 stop:781 length:243 start_codon:yes stop_codon:yes gene_type:complete